MAQGRTGGSSAQGDEDSRDRESELDRLTRRRAEKQAQRDYLAECSTESEAAVGSLDVEIAALSEQIDMAEQQLRESDEDRLAKALEQSRLEHDQARLDLARSASLGAQSLPACSMLPLTCAPDRSRVACWISCWTAQCHRGSLCGSRTSSACRQVLVIV